MDHDKVLSVFLPCIEHIVDILHRHTTTRSFLDKTVITCDFGFFLEDSQVLHENIGQDFITKLEKTCYGNIHEQQNKNKNKVIEDTMEYTKNSSDINNRIINKTFIEEHVYKYYMTPFDLRLRIWNEQQNSIMTKSHEPMFITTYDTWFECSDHMFIITNMKTGRCSIETHVYELRRQNISDFFIVHSILLISRDIINMIEEGFSDLETSLKLITETSSSST